jgi:2,4-dienoyl-CoA reductase-like NADH-dependent reductase (Old Yellow Enzyme family)
MKEIFMSKLFEPLSIKSITLKNRIVVSPMCQYSSQDGFANDWHLVHLGSRAIGGAALIIFEASAVAAEGRITPFDLGIYKDEHIEGLKRITNFIHQHHSVAGIQLAHAGRKASTHQPWKGGKQLTGEEGAWQTVAPSAIPFYENNIPPKQLSIDEIKQVIADFKTAATRALQAGFKVVEIHAAHGYLINEFLSPLTNKRTDEYGGNFENRTKLLLEIIKEVRAIWPNDLPLFVRISATEYVENGWNENDSVQLSIQLKNLGVDVIDCSTGGNIPHIKIPLTPKYQAPFAEKIKHEADTLTGAVGLITTAQQAEDILQNNQADLIFMAREFLRDPYFPLHAAKQLGDDIAWPVQYERAK